MKNRSSVKIALSATLSLFALAACNGASTKTVTTTTTTSSSTSSYSPGPALNTEPVQTTTVIVQQPIIDTTTTVLAPVTVVTQPVVVSAPVTTTSSYDGGYSSGYDSGYDSGDDSRYDDDYSSGDDGDSYYSSGSADGGCDSSGCNSFGSGGSKNTGLLAAKVTKAQMTAKANSVASQFQMSFDSAYKLTQLASQVQGMKQQRQMTQADRDAVVQSAFKIAGVTQTEVANAVGASLQNGDQKAIEDVMSKAAQNLGMPSGQTFRDKLLPLFNN